jgi:serine protease inhibitor
MWNRALAVAAALAALAAAPGSAAGARSGPRAGHRGASHPAPLSPAQGTAALGLDLLRRLPGANVVLSPDSIETALAMAGEGARGSTARQIAHVAHLPSPSSFGAVGSLQARLAAELGASAGSDPEAPKLEIADGLFLQLGFPVQAPFLAALQERFGAAPQLVDFAGDSVGAVQAINEWADQHTEGVIPSIVAQLPPTVRLALLNAIYLDARWASPFKASDVAPADFHGSRGTTRVPFMSQTEQLPYASGRGWRAVELPYRSSTLSLLVVLPRGRSLGRLARGLTARRLGAIARAMRPREVALSLPRFHVALERELGETLAGLGMPQAFSEGAADFSGISPVKGLHIGQVTHAADIRADEQGTVAAAVTVITIELSSAEVTPQPKVRFDADRPFLFFVRDSRTGAVLFAGRLSEAAAAQS